MFAKVLIANRGAIACRIIRTLDRMGVGSVAVFADSDAFSLHVERAGETVELGEGRASDTYLDVDKIIAAARETGAGAIHPGYGFLSENAAFAQRCEAEGIAFIGPTPEQIRVFGQKHTARALAERSEVPLLPGTSLLEDLDAALAAADGVGFPLMLKSTAGGGGIGMARCNDRAELEAAFESVQRLAGANFGSTGVFLERFVEHARHVEVQVFGDGAGKVVSLGERDCSSQRRNQKVVEEAPAPGLGQQTRAAMADAAERLAAAVGYRSAGTVEFLYDPGRGEFYFLEVNTRLQVEHGVTEAVTGVDLVEWMVRTAAGEPPDLDAAPERPEGWSIQARLYAESPIRDFAPSSGLVTAFSMPTDARCDHWLTAGIEVSPLYDPLLAKIIVHGVDRADALRRLEAALEQTRVHGIDTNRDFLLAIARSRRFVDGEVDTGMLANLDFEAPVIEVIEPGLESTVQDWPGRRGYWHVGVPPSGPMDPVAHRLANRLVGNDEGTAALELAVEGPTLRFHAATCVAICGADMQPELDGRAIPMWTSVSVERGSTLRLGGISGGGQRAALAVAGGFDVPAYLDSRSTFILGGFGGHGGRRLRPGDVLRLAAPEAAKDAPAKAIIAEPPTYPGGADAWEIDVTYGPHGAPEFFTEDSIRAFFEHRWEVHYNSSRTGIRLTGPKPEWTRADGGEAGLHPSNIHDNAYAIGTIDFTGDMPVILGLDGPSLGGFVCPVTIVQADLWKLGQLSAGDRIRFRPVSLEAARRREREWQTRISARSAAEPEQRAGDRIDPLASTPILTRRPIDAGRVELVIRRSGDRALLLELGEMVLDLGLRLRIHALMLELEREPLEGIIDLTPGIRSLQVHYDGSKLDEQRVIDWLIAACDDLPPFEEMTVPTRTVYLPLAWDHEETRKAIRKYMQSVRDDAPWCPDNIEFIRRINGLDDREQVAQIVYDARYLVMGLGDVYLGAPVATPIDPRQRLVTTKYNPARTWTPENAVGIGGAYLCIYGMEGPGGYQFVGRTVQMWNRFRETEHFEAGRPWLLRFFDQIRFRPVEEDALRTIRRDFLRGAYTLEIEEGEFSAAEYLAFVDSHDGEIAAVRSDRERAFAEERERWKAAGVAEYVEDDAAGDAGADEVALPVGAVVHSAHLAGSVWEIPVEEGDRVEQGDAVVILESMKTELRVDARVSGKVIAVLCRPGQVVTPGQRLLAIQPD